MHPCRDQPDVWHCTPQVSPEHLSISYKTQIQIQIPAFLVPSNTSDTPASPCCPDNQVPLTIPPVAAPTCLPPPQAPLSGHTISPHNPICEGPQPAVMCRLELGRCALTTWISERHAALATTRTTRGGVEQMGLRHSETRRGRWWTTWRGVGSTNRKTQQPATTSTTLVRQLLDPASAEMAPQGTAAAAAVRKH